MKLKKQNGWLTATLLLVVCATPQFAGAQLNQNCTVSVLNRSVQANPDGTWVLPNVPSNIGQVRARATCVQNGVTTSGQSDFFTPQANGVVQSVNISFGTVAAVPAVLTVTTSSSILNSIGATAQLTVTSTFADGTTADPTAGKSGTNYTTSNPAVATVSPDGLVTAVSSGTTIISAMNEGALGVIAINVVLSGTSHGGIPDDWAIAHGLDPNDPAMPFEDPDHDGLNNLQEFQHGTDPHNPDTDGDGIPDGLEVVEGTDPLNPNSFNLAEALKSIQVSPQAFTINFNTLLGEGSRQLIVTGTLKDLNATQIDLTSTRKGTNYASSDLTICNFSAVDGQIFAGNTGTCTVTVSNSGFTAQATGTIKTFSPTPLSFISIPGFANNVKVNGNFAYVAAGSAGLQVVDVSDRSNPRIVASLPTPGNANVNDLRVSGNKVYLAADSAGLIIIDVTNPVAPAVLGSVKTPDAARDVAVSGNLAFIAAGASGLQIANISDPTAPVIVGSTSTLTSSASATPRVSSVSGGGSPPCGGGTAKGVAVSGNFALVAAGSGGLQVVDISGPANPQVLGCVAMPSGDARKVQVKGTTAFVAPYPDSLQVVDFSTPNSPQIVGTTSFTLGGRLQDVAVATAFGETLTFGADVFFVNGIPITNVTVPSNPVSVAIIDFRQFRDDNGHGIAADSAFVYMTGEEGAISDVGVNGDTRLYIGQYLALEDTAGIPPTAVISSPSAGATVIERQTVPVTVLATDDVAVASVGLTVNGKLVDTQTSPPYQFNVQVPVGISTVTLGAFAVDLGNNIGNALPVQLNVIPDPGTTVVGKVVDTDGNPVAGATVSTFGGRSSTTAADGSFSITQVPTVLGNIVVTASFVEPDGTLLQRSSSPTPPVPLGITTINSCVATPSGLVSWWPGDSNANDIADGNNGTLKNSAGFAPGLVGNAFLLDGANASVDVGDASNLQVSSGSFTALAWVNFNALQGDMSILDKMSANGTNVDGWRMLKQGDGRFWFCLGGSNGNHCFDPAYTVFSKTMPIVGAWYHVAAVKSGADFSIYVNGVLEDSRALPTAPPFLDTNSANLLLGSYIREGAHLNGLIDEAQLYNRALSASEIRSIFAAGSSGNCRGGPLDHAIVIVPVPTITHLSRKSTLAGSQATFSASGTTLTGSNFAFLPTASRAIGVQVNSINPTGTSAALTVSAPSGISGTFALVATNVGGSSSTAITPANRFTIVDPNSKADTDGDGFPDVIEALLGSDPLDPNSVPTIPSVPEAESLTVSLVNEVAPPHVSPSPVEADSLTVSLLNGVAPPHTTPTVMEADSLTVALLNGIAPPSPPTQSQEADSLTVSLLNGTLPQPITPAAMEADSLTVSLVNGIAPPAQPTTFEADSLTVSLFNSAPKTASRKSGGNTANASLHQRQQNLHKRIKFSKRASAKPKPRKRTQSNEGD